MPLLDARGAHAHPEVFAELGLESLGQQSQRLNGRTYRPWLPLGYRQAMAQIKKEAKREAAQRRIFSAMYKARLEHGLAQEFACELRVRRARGERDWGLKKAIRRDMMKAHGISDRKLRAIIARHKAGK